MKTNFKRKPSTIKELLPGDEFVIEKMINIEKNLFYKFINNLLDDYDFIKDNIDLMFCDSDNIWHVIGVKAEEFDIIILVQSEGASYCRYGSYIEKSKLNNK